MTPYINLAIVMSPILAMALACLVEEIVQYIKQ